MRFIRFAALGICDLATLLVLLILERNQYAWMHALDPAATDIPTDDNQAFKVALTGVMVAVCVVGHLWLVRTSTTSRRRLLGLAPAVLLILVWLVRFVL